MLVMPRVTSRVKLPMTDRSPSEAAMEILTHERTPRRRNHLRLVGTDERARSLVPVEDPTPGPRDAAQLVAHFDALLPDDDQDGGVFTLGAE
jgi:hypothetical protein